MTDVCMRKGCEARADVEVPIWHRTFKFCEDHFEQCCAFFEGMDMHAPVAYAIGARRN